MTIHSVSHIFNIISDVVSCDYISLYVELCQIIDYPAVVKHGPMKCRRIDYYLSALDFNAFHDALHTDDPEAV